MAPLHPTYPMHPMRTDDHRVDFGTGLPSLPVAWEEITRLHQQLAPSDCLGIIDFKVLSDFNENNSFRFHIDNRYKLRYVLDGEVRLVGDPPPGRRIAAGPRVGISRAAERPWRFRLVEPPVRSKRAGKPETAKRTRRRSSPKD